jgi:type I restriction enzyme M protein
VDLVERAFQIAGNVAEQPAARPLSADIFVHLVERYSQTKGQKSPDFFTPRSIVQLAVAAVGDVSPSAPRVYDPFCRAGEFLDEATTQLARDGHDGVQVVGLNPNPVLRSLAEMNLLLHGAEASINSSYWWETSHQQPFDFAFANPPFNMHMPLDVVHTQPWRYGIPPAGNANYAWLQHVISQLGTGGRAVVVMSSNAGFTTNSREHHIRAAMIEDGAVECLIGLPPNLFAGTAIPVSLWVLRKPIGQPSDVLFIDATELGTSVTRTLKTLGDETIGRIVRTLQRWRSGKDVNEIAFARAISVAELRDTDHKLSPAVHVEPRRTNVDPSAERKKITELVRRSSMLEKNVRPLESKIQQLSALIEGGRGRASHRRTALLGHLCELKAGPGGSRLGGEAQRAGGIPVVLPRHLQNGKVTERPDTGLTENSVGRLAGYHLIVDDVVISRTAEPGRVARVTSEQSGWLFSTGLIRLRIHDGDILPAYLAHLLLSDGSHAWMVRHMAGTVVPAITLTALARLPLALPPLDEQERLSSALDAVAEQARVYEELSNATRSLRETLAHSLFAVPE